MSDLINALQGAGRSSSVLGAIANPTQVNPLAAYGAAAETATRMYQARHAQAQQLAGEAFQNSLNPDGTPNQAAFNRNLVAAGPNAAMAALSSSQAGVTLDSDTFALHSKRLAGVSAAMMGLIADNPHGVPQDQINAAIDAQLKAGNLTPEQAAAARSQFSADPVGNTRMLLQNNGRVISAQQQLENARPSVSLEDVGGAKVPVSVTPRSSTTEQPGTTTVAPGGVTTGLTPEQRNAPYSYKDPDTGQTVQTTWGAFLDSHGFPQPKGGQPVPGGGNPPPNLRNPARQGASGTPGSTPSAPNATPPAPQPVPVAPMPGKEAQWEASTKQYTADTEASGSYQQRIFPLVQGRALLESGDVTTGRGAEYVQGVKNMLGTVAGQMGWNPNAINNAKFEELNKYLTQYTNSLPMAGASDARLASALTGNPSAHISTLANKDVVKALIGLERMKQTAITDFAAQGGQPKDYADYLRTWQNTHDPRAFVFDMLDADARKKMVAGMKTDTERQAFARTLDLVERNPGVMGQAALPH